MAEDFLRKLRLLARANPEREVEQAIVHHDLRFLSLGESVPGLQGGAANPLVGLDRVHLIEGMGDRVLSVEHRQVQEKVACYAERYNHLLFLRLIKIKAPLIQKARRLADEELTHLEKTDPVAAAQATLVRFKGEAILLEVLGQKDRTPGVSDTQFLSLGAARGVTPLHLCRDYLTTTQNQQLDRVIRVYVIPYNQFVFQYYKGA